VKGFALGRKLRELFSGKGPEAGFYEELEDLLIEGDLGPAAAAELIAALREQQQRGGRRPDREEGLKVLRGLLARYLRVQPLEPAPGTLNLFLVLGVNGVGKTTAIAKLADYYRRRHSRVLLAAADTFRAAAIDQLASWAQRLGLPVVRQQPGADPGAVIYDAISAAAAQGADLVLADTAGRMHNKAHLVRELAKIDRIVRGRVPEPGYRRLLVIDATTGQNALRQAEAFREAVGVDSIFLAKYDSTAKGGVVLTICHDLQLPFSFMGTGERLEDLKSFDAEQFLDSLVGLP
jgi:fused signal recognition particle receptor